MGQLLRFILLLIAGLALLAIGATQAVQRTTQTWFERDISLRAQLAVNGAWWSLVGPALMSVLLLRVSGVTLLERDIGKRRPGYAEYIRRTNAFFPGPRRP